MTGFIKKQTAINELEERIRANGCSNTALISELNKSIGYLMRLPVEDVVEVVRCKDCRYLDRYSRCELWECHKMPGMGYCHEGVRK